MFVDGKYRILVILLGYGISTWILEFGKFVHPCLKLSLISFYFQENLFGSDKLRVGHVLFLSFPPPVLSSKIILSLRLQDTRTISV
jgi:hypothetical protein